MSFPTKISASVVSLTCKVTNGFGTAKHIDYYYDHNIIIILLNFVHLLITDILRVPVPLGDVCLPKL